MAELDRQDLNTLIDFAIDAGPADPVRRRHLLAEIPRRLLDAYWSERSGDGFDA